MYSGHVLRPEAYSLGGFFLTFIALSLSHYKLPHYIFITLPWASVLLAGGFTSLTNLLHRARWAAVLLFYLPLSLIIITAFLLIGFVFPTVDIWIWLPLIGMGGWLMWQIWHDPFPKMPDVWVQRGVMAALAGMFVMNFHFYPRLLPYQSTSRVAKFAREAGIPTNRMGHYGRHGHALDFYSQRILPDMINPQHIQSDINRMGTLWLYTTVSGKADLDGAGIKYEVVGEFDHFQVALLSPQFLNPATREQSLERVYLLRIEPIGPRR